jgi:uncharacterized protein (DUF1501 family)
MSNRPLTRRAFLRQINCAAVGTAAVLNTVLNLRLAEALTLANGNRKTLVCLFLNGGCDTVNVLVPWETSLYNTYAASRGAYGSNGGLALNRTALLPLAAPAADFGLHPSCVKLHQMATGTGAFAGNKRLSFLANVGTLVQPITKTQFNAWETGQNAALPVPRALFSHIDQVEQWQTAVPQGLQQLTGWAGRAADILHAGSDLGTSAMNIAFGGNSIFQIGSQTEQLVVSSSGALSFTGQSGGANNNPLQLKNAALRSTLEQQYSNLLTESFARLTRSSDDAQQLFQSMFTSTAAELGPSVNALFPGGDLSDALRAAVKTIKIRAELGLTRQTLFINHTGWDHHGELLNTQASMLSTLDNAIGAYQQALDMLGLAGEVVTFTASDFGRTLRSNGRGSDHAWGGHALVFGGPVDGGKIFGTYPDLSLGGPDDIGHGGRLLPSMPVDLLFAELLRWFGVPAGSMSYVLPNITNFWDPYSVAPPIGCLL